MMSKEAQIVEVVMELIKTPFCRGNTHRKYSSSGTLYQTHIQGRGIRSPGRANDQAYNCLIHFYEGS